MIRSEAIELLNEIANTDPEILQTATQISLDPEEAPNCKIIFKTSLSEKQREFLSAIVSSKGLKLSEYLKDIWIIE